MISYLHELERGERFEMSESSDIQVEVVEEEDVSLGEVSSSSTSVPTSQGNPLFVLSPLLFPLFFSVSESVSALFHWYRCRRGTDIFSVLVSSPEWLCRILSMSNRLCDW